MIGKTPVVAINDNCFCYNKNQEQQEFIRTQVKSIEIPDSIEQIGAMAFYGCVGLEKIKISKKLRKLNNSLFCGCENLTIDIPEGIEEIGSHVFEATKLKTVTIPKSVKTIDEGAFFECRTRFQVGMMKLESIEVDAQSKYFKSIDGVLFSYDGTILYKYPQAKKEEVYEVPFGVTKIAENAFAYAINLKTVTIPETVNIISNNVFFKCNHLECVHMPKKLSLLGNAFCECESLKEIDVPNGLTEIASMCFYNCINLNKVSLPNKLKSIRQQAFDGCRNLTEITIPSTVRSIGQSAFSGCSSLKSIIISKSVTGIGYGVFKGCDQLTIYTTEGSGVYVYAKKEKINVEILNEE